jgi:hypothetical protein
MKELGASKLLHEGRTTRCTNMVTALTDMSIQFEVQAVYVDVEAPRNVHKLQGHSIHRFDVDQRLLLVWKVLASSLTYLACAHCRIVEIARHFHAFDHKSKPHSCTARPEIDCFYAHKRYPFHFRNNQSQWSKKPSSTNH